MNRFTTVAASIAIVLGTAGMLRAGEVQTPGKLHAVTVYRGQALVTRLVEIPGPAGLHEVIVTDLPEHVVPGSLYAESADGVQVRSVLYRQRPVTQDVREEVRKLDDQIRQLNDKIAANAQSMQLLAERRALVEKLESFTAPTSSVELTKGVLNPTTMKDMATYLLEQRKINSDEEFKLKLARRDLEEQLALIQRQRDQVAGASARTAREALVFVNLQKPNGQLVLRYLVNQATWEPSYTVRAGSDRSNVTVEYQASVQQMSGEDWNNVTMTLSTATPSLIAKAPKLDPLQLELAALTQQVELKHAEAEKLVDELNTLQLQTAQSRKIAYPYQRAGGGRPGEDRAQAAERDAAAFDDSLNDIACRIQVLEWGAPGDMKKSREKIAKPTVDSVSVTYQLAGHTSLPSRSDRQLIQIASMQMRGDFYKLAVPLLTDAVYDEAVITNAGTMVLLAGPAASYLNGEFVGHGEIPTVAVGEQFTLGFGIDSSLRASRELIEKFETLQGGNRIVDLTYRLAVENFGETPAKVRLLDRKPMSNGSEVRSTLISAKPEISSDSNYVQTDQKKGILRWDIEVPAQAIATSAAAVEYQLRLEYDKQMTITGIALANP